MSRLSDNLQRLEAAKTSNILCNRRKGRNCHSSGTAYISNNLVYVYGSDAGTMYNFAIMLTTN